VALLLDMTDEQEWEYDLAVSFAGEQRNYVEAVVRGIGDERDVPSQP